MPIIQTEAVILKCSNYRETSKIITFFTNSHGKIKCIAKGVRNSRSRWGGALQTMALVKIIFYYKETRTLHLISGAEHLITLNSIYDDFEKMQFGYRMIELVNRTTAEYQENTKIYNLLANSLQILESATKNYVNVLFNFELRLLELLGYNINIDMLPDENVEIKAQNRYFYENRFSSGDQKALEVLSGGNFNTMMALNISKQQVFALEKFFENYLRDHFEHAGFSNAKKVFNSQDLF
ncbi:MAG: DNA repair protein RecO [Ignavibacteria bacterium]|nr:DNA repair protein RecO [Ignavibacteria bacterium]